MIATAISMLLLAQVERTGVTREPTTPSLVVSTQDIVCGGRSIRASFASSGGRYVDQSIFIAIEGRAVSGLPDANGALAGTNINGIGLVSCERGVYSFVVLARRPGRQSPTDRTSVGLIVEQGILRVSAR